MPKIITQEKRAQIKKTAQYLKINNPRIGQGVLEAQLADIFGAGTRTIQKILTGQQHTEKPLGRPKKTETSLDYNFKRDLQRQIWKYNSTNEYFTLQTLLTYAKENLEFKGGRTSLYRILKSMGYKFKTVNGRKILCEQKHVVATKITFLRKYLQYKNLGENIRFVYLDETWIYQNGSQIRRWMHESDMKSNPSKISSEGKRFTILHAGSYSGFLDGCDFFLDSQNNDRDYHNTMNADLFQKWVVNQLIPALRKFEGKCVVVMDNAPYHSELVDKIPTFSSKKDKMQEWLTKRKITFDTNMTKKQLWNLIQPFRNSPKRYKIDEILTDHGHEVLRLPPYHCQYNPIEMAWGFCKYFYNKTVLSQPPSRDRVARVWRESLSKCTSDMWTNFCRHCDTLISEDWRKHMGDLPFDNIPPFIISLGESDSESDSEMLSESEEESNSPGEMMEVE